MALQVAPFVGDGRRTITGVFAGVARGRRTVTSGHETEGKIGLIDPDAPSLPILVLSYCVLLIGSDLLPDGSLSRVVPDLRDALREVEEVVDKTEEGISHIPIRALEEGPS